jgi:indole-3-glycerol phosphate synthase
LILDEIIESKRAEVERLKLAGTDLEAAATAIEPPRGFEAALRAPGAVSVIAEFKRRSPSEGDIHPYADVSTVARAYEAGGAAAMSVLTDGPYFGGDLRDLRRARSDSLLKELRACAEDLGMAALIEAHDEAEVERALDAGARIVGVNARDLQTFRVDLDTSLELIGRIDGDVTAVAESGVKGGEDVARAGGAGADAVLVGGWLMKSDPQSGVAELVGHRRRPRSARKESDAGGLDEEADWSG